MSFYEWLPAPVDIDAPHWVTRSGCRNVVVAAHTVTSLTRLLDVVGLIETDPKMQLVFAVPPATFNFGVHEHLSAVGAMVIPWQQATKMRFDLGLAADCSGLDELHAPLVVMAHGAGFGKRAPAVHGAGPVTVTPPVYGLDAQRLIRDGRVLASALVLSHDKQLDVLRHQCPEAEPVAVVAGDPCFDRLVASLPLRDRYRETLDVSPTQELVVVSSTWGRNGLFGQCHDLLPKLMTELPRDRFRIAALLHPAVWSAHGRRQVKAWLRECLNAGLTLVEPEEDWRAAIIAADHVVGDQGSVTAYAAGIGQPILHLAPPVSALPTEGSAQEYVMLNATPLQPAQPLLDQIRAAKTLNRHHVAGLLTSEPGQAAIKLRRVMYRLLKLPQPGRHRHAEPVPVTTPPASQSGS